MSFTLDHGYNHWSRRKEFQRRWAAPTYGVRSCPPMGSPFETYAVCGSRIKCGAAEGEGGSEVSAIHSTGVPFSQSDFLSPNAAALTKKRQSTGNRQT